MNAEVGSCGVAQRTPSSDSMSRPGFRRSIAGGAGWRVGSVDSAGTSGMPFSQAQIMHLMKTEFARARRYGYPVSCLLMQVDRLQALTDIHGVELKEVVRRELGALVAEQTRGHDHVGLISDESYLLVLPHTDGEQANAVADRILASFRRLEVESQGGLLPLNLSMGISSCEDQETLFFDTMVSQAEVALEWAMQDGGGRAVQFRRERFVRSTPGDPRP